MRLNLPSSLERILTSGSNNPLKSHIEAHWQPTSNSQILPQLYNNQVSEPLYLKQLGLNHPPPASKVNVSKTGGKSQAWGNYQQGQVQLPLHLNSQDSVHQPRPQQIEQEVSQHEPEAGGSGQLDFSDVFFRTNYSDVSIICFKNSSTSIFKSFDVT